MTEEIWKDVKGYEGLYMASNLGRIKSLPRATTSGRILRQYINRKNGYCYVSLSKENVQVSRRVHKLVLMAFNPVDCGKGYNKEFTINHIDGNKANNALLNLEWCTQSENQIKAYEIGINGKSTRPVIDLDTLEVFESEREAVESVGGKKSGAVQRVCVAKRSQYRNHRFAYYEDYLNGTIPVFKGKAKRSAEMLWR